MAYYLINFTSPDKLDVLKMYCFLPAADEGGYPEAFCDIIM